MEGEGGRERKGGRFHLGRVRFSLSLTHTHTETDTQTDSDTHLPSRKPPFPPEDAEGQKSQPPAGQTPAGTSPSTLAETCS